jgi:hypothetical protein
MNEILKILNQRPIAYYPIYRQITGSTTAGILLSQLMYWFSKKDKFYKTDADIIEETMLTKKELETAKKKIKQLSFISITREGIPAKTYYQIDWELYQKELEKWTSNIPQNSNINIPQKGETGLLQKGETITKTNTKIKTKINTSSKKEKKEKENLVKGDSLVDKDNNEYLLYKNINNGGKEKDNLVDKDNNNNKTLSPFYRWLKDNSKMAYNKKMEFDSIFGTIMQNYTLEELAEVLEWAIDNSFWQDKLLKPESIKRNFETIRMQMLKEKDKNEEEVVEGVEVIGFG